MDEQLERLDEALWVLRNRIWGDFFYQVGVELLNSDLSIQQLFTLLSLKQWGTCNISAIAEKSGLSAAASSQMIDKLVQFGLVIRSENPQDRRQKCISLAEKGGQLVKKFEEQRSESVKKLLSKIPVEILTQFENSLRQILPFLDKEDLKAATNLIKEDM